MATEVRLVAALIVGNGEIGRYLPACIEHLRTYVDEIRAVDDSDDGTGDWLRKHGVQVTRAKTRFRDNEGMAREAVWDWAREAEATHFLAIDADEFIATPLTLLARIASDPRQEIWTVDVAEVWGVTTGPWRVRTDGGWGAMSGSPVLFRADVDRNWTIPHRQLACGREPVWVREQTAAGLAKPLGVELLHLGWANPATREARLERYLREDGGQFHSRAHLESVRAEPTLVDYEVPGSLRLALEAAGPAAFLR